MSFFFCGKFSRLLKGFWSPRPRAQTVPSSCMEDRLARRRMKGLDQLSLAEPLALPHHTYSFCCAACAPKCSKSESLVCHKRGLHMPVGWSHMLGSSIFRVELRPRSSHRIWISPALRFVHLGYIAVAIPSQNPKN